MRQLATFLLVAAAVLAFDYWAGTTIYRQLPNVNHPALTEFFPTAAK